MSRDKKDLGNDCPPEINWIACASSRMTHIGYRPDRHTIYVRFHNETEWQYRECSQVVWEAFSTADSLGRYINEHLNRRPNQRRAAMDCYACGAVNEGDCWCPSLTLVCPTCGVHPEFCACAADPEVIP